MLSLISLSFLLSTCTNRPFTALQHHLLHCIVLYCIVLYDFSVDRELLAGLVMPLGYTTLIGWISGILAFFWGLVTDTAAGLFLWDIYT